MKIAIVAPSSVPFSRGGAERAWSGILRELNERTPHDAELIKLPAREDTLPDLAASYEAFARLDVSHFDLVITTKYPAWMVQHENHVVYVFHRLRGLYDTYALFGLPERVDYAEPDLRALQALIRRPPDRALLDDFFALFRNVLAARGPADPAFCFPGPLAREIVHFLDAIAMDPRYVRRYLALSRTVAARAGYFPPGVPVEVAYLPPDLEGLCCGSFDYFFSPGRLDAPKRFDLLIRAMPDVPGQVPLRIAGAGPDSERLRSLAAGNPRIEFLGFVTDEQLVDLYADALAVPFCPYDEDFGLVALEAMASGKPVVTCSDSGGPTELVADGTTGYVTAPSAEALAQALTRLAEDPGLARMLGEAGRRRAERVTWAATISALLQRGNRRPAAGRRPGRRKLVVTSTFRVHPPRGGGQLRSFHLFGALTSDFDVEIVSLGRYGESPSQTVLRPGLVETVIPKSQEHELAEQAVSARVDWLPVTDIVAGPLITRTPAYLSALRAALRDASAVVLSHPFLLPAVELLGTALPLLYDAQDAEIALKEAVLPGSETGEWLRGLVYDVEGAAVRKSLLVSTCSSEDAELLSGTFGVEPERFLVVPNGVDVAGTPFVTGGIRAASRERWLRSFLGSAPAADGVRRLAVFFGSWHPPNLAAAEHVLALAEQLPEVLFVLAGSQCDSLRFRIVPANVVLAGVVSDATKLVLLRSADVALNPMTLGSGTNLKMVEYVAAGVPVVSTPLGARGLHVKDGVHALLAPIEEFPPAVRRLLANRALADRIAAQGRRLVENSYDWRIVGRRFSQVFDEAVDGKGR